MAQRLTGRQTAIMQALWDRGEATVAEVQETLAASHEPLAYTTIATLLARMERRGLVKHRAEGRTFIYAPLLSQDKASSSLLGELLGRFFDGRPSELVSHLLEREEIDSRELSRIKLLLAEHETARRSDKGKKA